MALTFFNQLGKTQQVFTPRSPGEVSFYACGPTVYDSIHIGNWRTFVFVDLLRRVLRYSGLKVTEAMNITDIDDKIINRAKDEGLAWTELAQKYTDQFFADRDRLNILAAEHYPRATGHLPAIINLIKQLLAKGLAYEQAGSIYFSVKKFPDYGKLSNVSLKDLKAGARVEIDEETKVDPADFVLWKAAKADEPSFPSPWGSGRPGWHIECSAMSMALLGESFDIHTGGIDLLFPHHENEIAQSEGATGAPLANYWLEGEHLMIDGEKMSKSLDNILTLADIEAKGYSPLDLRYLFLTASYRKPLNFTWESLSAAKTARQKLNNFMLDWNELTDGQINGEYQNKFRVKIEDDLNLPQALALVWELIDDPQITAADKKATLLDFDQVFGLGLADLAPLKIPPAVETLVLAREKARVENNYLKADQLRSEIDSLGFTIEDSPAGPRLRQK